MANESARRRGSKLWYLLLILPYIGLLWVPFYNSLQPQFWGIPFFYWYQFLWIIISAVLTWIVYRATS